MSSILLVYEQFNTESYNVTQDGLSLCSPPQSKHQLLICRQVLCYSLYWARNTKSLVTFISSRFLTPYAFYSKTVVQFAYPQYYFAFQFYIICSVLDSTETLDRLCPYTDPCEWGTVANVRNKLLYVSQPSLKRVVVIDARDNFRPKHVGHLSSGIYAVCFVGIAFAKTQQGMTTPLSIKLHNSAYSKFHAYCMYLNI